MCVASCSCCSALHIPHGFPELLNGHFGFQESTHKGRLGEGTAGPGMLLWAGAQAEQTLQTPSRARGAATPPKVRLQGRVTGVPPS